MKKFVLFGIVCLLLSACQNLPNAHVYQQANANDKCYIYQDAKKIDTVLAYSIDSYGLPYSNNANLLNNAQNALKLGCNVNEISPNSSLRPIEQAVLYQNSDFIKLLMANGANPTLKIQNAKTTINGKNLFEFSEWLAIKQPTQERIFINQLLQNYKK